METHPLQNAHENAIGIAIACTNFARLRLIEALLLEHIALQVTERALEAHGGIAVEMRSVDAKVLAVIEILRELARGAARIRDALIVLILDLRGERG